MTVHEPLAWDEDPTGMPQMYLGLPYATVPVRVQHAWVKHKVAEGWVAEVWVAEVWVGSGRSGG